MINISLMLFLVASKCCFLVRLYDFLLVFLFLKSIRLLKTVAKNYIYLGNMNKSQSKLPNSHKSKSNDLKCCSNSECLVLKLLKSQVILTVLKNVWI